MNNELLMDAISYLDSDLLAELLPDTSALDRQILEKKAEATAIEATVGALERIYNAL